METTTESGRALWPRAEMLQLLHEWRRAADEAHLQLPDEPNSAKNGPLGDAVLRATCSQFLALPSVRGRSADAVTRFLHRLKRTARVALAYNARKKQLHSARKNQLHSAHANPWLALSGAQQLRVFSAQHAAAGFVALDAELFEALEAVVADKSEPEKSESKKKKTVVVPGRAIPSSASAREKTKAAPWTKGEVWVLLTAWRHVLERGDQGSARAVFTSFCALGKVGMPARSESAVKNKMGNLVQLYQLVEGFNASGGCHHREEGTNGPHSDGEDEAERERGRRRQSGRANWFDASSSERAQHLIEWTHRVNNVADFDRDTFNAMRMIMNHGKSAACAKAGSVAIIDISSDSMEDAGEDDGEEGDDGSWELLARTPTSGFAARGSPAELPTTADAWSHQVALSPESRYQWPTVYQPSAWETTKRETTPERATQSASSNASEPRFNCMRDASRQTPATSVNRFPYAAPVIAAATADSDSDDDMSQQTRVAYKSAMLDSESPSQLPTQQTQKFLDILAKLKKERKADKAKRREERAERRELMELIWEEREQRRNDKKERRRERREWELERDRLRFELKRMREKYKSVRRKLRAS